MRKTKRLQMIRNKHLNEVNYLNDKTYTKESVSEIKLYVEKKKAAY